MQAGRPVLHRPGGGGAARFERVLVGWEEATRKRAAPSLTPCPFWPRAGHVTVARDRRRGGAG